VPFKDRLNESSTTPVQAGDLLIAGSVTAGAIAVRPKPDHSAAEVVWRNRALTMYFSTPVLAGGKLFVITGAATLTNPAVHLHCVEPESGKVLWTREKVGKYHAALLRTGNEQLLMFDDSGTLTLFSANPQQYAEICRAKLCADTWAHPAISNRRLVIRDGKELLAYDFSTIGR
jgi:outer membrane protein assembly factor BamB